jgi:membrane associated rhomboid family serine protease
MLLPLSTDVEQDQPPVTNVLIVVSAVVAFLATHPWVDLWEHRFALNGWSPLGLVGHLWLHGSFWHIFGNMIFLWVFGNAVCSRVGNLRYPAVYVGVGVAAGLAHVLADGHPAIGASGAVNGIVGMFAVLFPESRVRVLLAIFWTWGGVWAVPSGLLIALWFVLDLYGALHNPVGIAYWAHIGGFLAGFFLGIVFVQKGWVKLYRGEKTLLHMTGWSPPAPPAPAPPPRRAWHPVPAAAKLAGAAAPPHREDARPPAPAGIEVRCTCGTILTCPEDQAGQYVKCDRCHAWVRAPRREHGQEGPPRPPPR